MTPRFVEFKWTYSVSRDCIPDRAEDIIAAESTARFQPRFAQRHRPVRTYRGLSPWGGVCYIRFTCFNYCTVFSRHAILHVVLTLLAWRPSVRLKRWWIVIT